MAVNKNLEIAKAYYIAMSEKRTEDMLNLLSDEIVLKSPLGVTSGKEAVKNSIIHFVKVVKNIEIKNAFSNDNKVVLNLDFSCEKPFGDFPSIVVITFDNKDKILNSELFYDTKLFEGGEFDV